MIRRPPRSTRVRSSAASDVYKRQADLEAALAGGYAPLSGRGEVQVDVAPPSARLSAAGARRIALIGLCRAATDKQQAVVLARTTPGRAWCGVAQIPQARTGCAMA